VCWRGTGRRFAVFVGPREGWSSFLVAQFLSGRLVRRFGLRRGIWRAEARSGLETMASWVPCGWVTFSWREFSVDQDISMSVEAELAASVAWLDGVSTPPGCGGQPRANPGTLRV